MSLYRAIVLLVFTGCASALPSSRPPECLVDADCSSGNVCFPDGCGDPGRGIVVEITPSAQTGLHAQDFSIEATSATMAFEVEGPLTLAGAVQREEGPFGMTSLANYTEAVSVTASGESTLIPGVRRSYQYSAPKLELGIYQMLVGAGSYTVTARAVDKSIPVSVQENIVVKSGEPSGASFIFPSKDATLRLVGTLIKMTTSGQPPKQVLPDAFMEIQAFDSGGHALSQPADVSKDTGDFQLSLTFAAAFGDSISLVARPRDGIALVPTKAFVLSPAPAASTTLATLELGDFGTSLVGTKGRLLTVDGQAVVGATVVAEGTTSGGGSFKSRVAVSDAEGFFKLDLLAGEGGSAYTLTIIPDPTSRAGITELTVKAAAVNGEPKLEPAEIVCPDRITVSGTVTRPDGDMPATDLTVTATAIESVDSRPLPVESQTVVTDNNGRYELRLDPAKYRIDYQPSGVMPRRTRVVRVERVLNALGEEQKTSDLGSLQLSLGRTVNGIVSVRGSGLVPGTGKPAPNARVRFFRVTSIEGQRSSLVVAEGVTDDMGRYTVVLPDHPVTSASTFYDGGTGSTDAGTGSPDGG